jgi:serine/threonine protein kinase
VRLGRDVALKFLPADRSHDPAMRRRLLHEARAASALNHPNIVTLYEVAEAEGQVFLAMQCVGGGSLRDRIRAGPLPPAETLAVGRGVADALAHAHGRGIVHRDVKPENILLGERGEPKVTDFGIAMLPGETRLTETGRMLGTVSYLAPEVLQGRPADPRSEQALREDPDLSAEPTLRWSRPARARARSGGADRGPCRSPGARATSSRPPARGPAGAP